MAAIFIVIAILNVFTYQTIAPSEKDHALLWVILSELWITVLLIGVWCRQKWGRYLLAGLSFLVTVLAAAIAPHHFLNGTPVPAYVPASIIVYLAIFLIIAYLPAIRILTRRRY